MQPRGHGRDPTTSRSAASSSRLGIGLTEIEDWNCCGATSYISMNKTAAYAISARNLAYAEKMGMNVCAPCSSCYTILSKVNRHMRWGDKHKNEINEALSAAGLSYAAKLEVLHPLDIIVNFYGIERVVERMVRSLDGLKIAPYYGCQIVRPMGRFDDREDPQPLDNLFGAIGGAMVPFPAKVRCCGGMLMTTYEDVALKLNRDILTAAAENGAEVLITTCPMCQINLEAYQTRINDTFGTAFRSPSSTSRRSSASRSGFSPEEMLLDQLMLRSRARPEAPARCTHERGNAGRRKRRGQRSGGNGNGGGPAGGSASASTSATAERTSRRRSMSEPSRRSPPSSRTWRSPATTASCAAIPGRS